MRATFPAVIFQIIMIDIVFSLDSIITAVGMVDEMRGHDRSGRRFGSA